MKDLHSCAGIPVWIGWIRYISFIYYGFGMLLHHEYSGRTIYSCVDSSLAQSAVAMSVQVTLHKNLSDIELDNPVVPHHSLFIKSFKATAQDGNCAMLLQATVIYQYRACVEASQLL